MISDSCLSDGMLTGNTRTRNGLGVITMSSFSAMLMEKRKHGIIVSHYHNDRVSNELL